MIHIDLYRKNWITQGAVSTIGWAEWMGKSYTGEAFNQLVLSCIRRKEHTLSQLAAGLNGNYAIVIQSKSSAFLISDHIRSYPLLYLKEKGNIYITDNLLASFEKYGLNPEVDIRKAEVFLTAGLTLEDSTLYKEVYALQAAEIVRINDQETEKKRYFTYASEFDPKKKLVVTEEVEKQNELFTRLFRRMRESAPEVRNWIVPLSGGHDSRMVLNQMHKLGIKNLICYSYGYPGNKQSRLSQQIAEALGYAWHFVEYTPEKWQALRESPDFDRYFDFAFNGVSDPHIQDLLAVSELKKQKILQPGDIFVPGHTFDFLTGAYCFDRLVCASRHRAGRLSVLILCPPVASPDRRRSNEAAPRTIRFSHRHRGNVGISLSRRGSVANRPSILCPKAAYASRTQNIHRPAHCFV
ncbi:hypothetical protein LJC39_03150 [Parabacteroides sp. OttesenSCG-928-B22]|nr:hypothetical protein [Parabacteroides sp. OttesenSCG-928-B22]